MNRGRAPAAETACPRLHKIRRTSLPKISSPAPGRAENEAPNPNDRNAVTLVARASGPQTRTDAFGNPARPCVAGASWGSPTRYFALGTPCPCSRLLPGSTATARRLRHTRGPPDPHATETAPWGRFSAFWNLLLGASLGFGVWDLRFPRPGVFLLASLDPFRDTC